MLFKFQYDNTLRNEAIEEVKAIIEFKFQYDNTLRK